MTRKRFTDADYQVNASIVKANNKAIMGYSVEEFWNYLNAKYGNIVSLDFIVLMRSELLERDLTNKITYDNIFTEMVKDPFMTRKTTLKCIETDRKIYNLENHESIINDFEIWING